MEPKSKARRGGWRKELKDWTLTLGSAVLISFLIQNYAFAQVRVEQHSMDTTLAEGQRLVENRLVYKFSEPERGDIVIVNGPESDRRLVKRIIGLPGDVLDIKDGSVWINGERLEEPYAAGRTLPGRVKLPLTVPDNAYFVLGDNREHSEDSRNLGTMSKTSVEGKAMLRLYPFRQFKIFE
ncbi:signal peptidase I [Gorillibacterium sp. sgz5001074]|uniref:signal peptidase I n=1 Tax=Gorillibacterium sp. sgz5001074 TaxID=3446695 RepID=UPI003F668F85